MTHATIQAAAAESDVGDVAGLAFVLGLFTLALVLVLFLLRQGVTVYRTRAAAGRDEELRELLAKSAAAQERHAASVERAEARIAELSERFGNLERVLKDVE